MYREKFDKVEFQKTVKSNVKRLYRKTVEEATQQQLFQAVSYAVKDDIIDRWLMTQEQYKKDLFRIKISSGKFPSSDNHYIVISEKEAFNGTEILLKKTNDIPINDLIVQLAEKFSLTAFEEILPSMNEIFIETVEREKTL